MGLAVMHEAVSKSFSKTCMYVAGVEHVTFATKL